MVEAENEFLKLENYRLQHENKLIKQEKSFLIEQIKFMQNLIKSNNVNISIENKNSEIRNENFDIEKNINTNLCKNTSHLPVTKHTPIQLNGGNQKPLGKIFSVFVICMLSMAYVSFDPDFASDEKITVRNGSTFSLNDSSDRQQIVKNNFSSFYSNLFKFLFVLICGMLTWNISKFKSYLENVFRIKDKNL